MRALLLTLTIRGRSFLAAGVASMACGLLIPEPDLLRIGALLVVVPVLSAFGAGRARYRLSCARRAGPAGPQELQRRPWGCAQSQLRGLPRRVGDRDDVLLDLLGDVHATYRVDEGAHVGPGGDRLELV